MRTAQDKDEMPQDGDPSDCCERLWEIQSCSFGMEHRTCISFFQGASYYVL